MPLASHYQWIFALSQKIVVVSEAVREEIEPFVPPGKIEVVHTGMPALQPSLPPRTKEELFGFAEDTPVVTFLGELSERKGVLDLAAAAKQVLERVPTARFVLAGRDAEKAAALREKIAQDGTSDAFLLLGLRKDVADILAASDLLVLPALVDPLPLAVLEGMGMGRPIVATRCGGIPEMVVHGETGLLVPVADPVELAAAILTILQSPETGREFGRRAQERFHTHFSMARHSAHIQRIFREAAAERPKSLDRAVAVAITGLVKNNAELLGRLAQQADQLGRFERELAAARTRLARFENHPILRYALKARRQVRRLVG
jgi:glycosyltransferase involved in cell wall biosynthesis